MGETPVPIPNTMVKTQAADDTILETVWESRWVPDFKKRNFTNDLRSKKHFGFNWLVKQPKWQYEVLQKLYCTLKIAY